MTIARWKKIVGATIGGGVFSVFLTLRAYNYDTNSLGFVRLGRAAVTVFKVGLLYKYKLYSSSLDVNSDDFIALRSDVHREGALMLLKLCCTNKGVYIKVGQHIGALDYLVPPEYVDVMKVLHSNAPKSSFKEICTVLKEDLKQQPFEVFSSIDEEPLGAASLAQVHKAVLKEGNTVVAVKVQHPLVLRNSLVDLKTMEVLVKIVSAIFKDFKFQWLVDETKRNLPKELDFSLEGKNAEIVQEKLSCFDWLKIPKVYWELTTKRVLTMEYVEGGQVNNLDYVEEKQIDKQEVTSKLGEVYSHMIFKHGFVHSDPHPGNILLHKTNNNTQLILLDHGLYAELSQEFRWTYSKLWMSILNRDLKAMRQHSEALGIGPLYPLLVCMVTGRTWDSINNGIESTRYTSNEKAAFQREIPNLLSKINDVLDTVDRQMLLILKTNDLLRGVEHTLRTDKRQTSFLVMTRCCVENLYQEKLLRASSTWARLSCRFWRQWVVLKLSLYHAYLYTRYMVAEWA